MRLHFTRRVRTVLTFTGTAGFLFWLVLAPAQAFDPKRDGSSDWPQFLGPQRNGVSRETGLLKTWPVDGPKEVWRVKGGVGMSGISIVAGKLYTMVQKGGQQFAVALDQSSGKTVWQTSVAPSYENGMGNGPRATPAVFGKTVFTFSGEGFLTALDAERGSIIWSHNVVEELNGKPAEYGMASSPLVVNDNVIVTVGAPGATVVAYNRTTGELSWKAGQGEAAGYSSPALLTVGGQRQVVAFSGAAATGIEPKSGDILWRYPYQTNYDCNIATPLSFKGQVFLSSGDNHGSAMLRLKPSGKTLSIEEVWKSQGLQSVLRNEWQTSMLLDGYLYGFDNVGAAGPVTHFTCVEAVTGKRIWQKRRFGKGNVIAADGKLFISTVKGELVVLRATPNGFDELGRTKVIGPTRQAPALSGGRLFLRDNREIVCLDVRKK